MSPQTRSFIQAVTDHLDADPLPCSAACSVQAATLLGEIHRSYCELVRLLGASRAQFLFAEFLRDGLPSLKEEAVPRSFLVETFDSWKRFQQTKP